jgi:hypothetical protein
MRLTTLLGAATAAAALLASSQALALNQGPPAGPQVLNLAGQAIPGSYTEFTADFLATGSLTNLSIALREDPAFIYVDNVSLTDLTNPGGELLTNGDFEGGTVGNSAPNGWTYLNVFGAAFGGLVNSGCGIGASNCYYDGAVEAYDAITQQVGTTTGDLYHLSLWVRDDGYSDTFRNVSNNGFGGVSGNGRNLVVYGGAIPTGAPEPATWGLMLVGFGGLGAVMRRRRAALA